MVSEAYASVPGDRAHEIGAIVRPELRRRELGYATCAALIDECRRRKYDTIWSCHRENDASARTGGECILQTRGEPMAGRRNDLPVAFAGGGRTGAQRLLA